MISNKTGWFKKLWLIVVLFMLANITAGNAQAAPGNPIPGEFSATFVGADPDTGELILEGPKTGALPGHLSIRAGVVRQTGRAMHITAQWTLTTPWGEILEGENTAVLNTSSLHFREHGIITHATGSLQEYIGRFIVVRGEFNNLSFIPGQMVVNGSATIVPSGAGR